MKKLLLFAAVVSAISFASCKKDHTCTCTTTSTSTIVTAWESGNSETDSDSDASTDVTIINDAKKGDAKKACINSNSTDTDVQEGTGYNSAELTYEDYVRTTTSKSDNACSLN